MKNIDNKFALTEDEISQMSIAVVIAHFNDPDGLARALLSVSNQTVSPYETVVVDDGSSSENFALVEELSTKFKFKLIRKDNGGQSSARNLGVRESASSHICFLDQDDEFIDTHIETLRDLWTRDSLLAFVYGDAWRKSNTGQVFFRKTMRGEFDYNIASIFDLASIDFMVTPGMTMISRSHFESVSGFDELLRGYEDDDLFFRFSLAGYKAIKTPKPVLLWTQDPNSTSYSMAMQVSRGIYFRKLVSLFDEPFFRQLIIHTFRDMFWERFYKMMREDAIRLASSGGPGFEVAKENLLFFCEAGLSSRGLTKQQRRSLLFTRWALASIPPRRFEGIFATAENFKRLLRL